MTALSWSLWSFGMHTLAHLPSATLLSLLYIFCLLLLSFSFSIPFSFFFTTPVILTAAVSYLDYCRILVATAVRKTKTEAEHIVMTVTCSWCKCRVEQVTWLFLRQVNVRFFSGMFLWLLYIGVLSYLGESLILSLSTFWSCFSALV